MSRRFCVVVLCQGLISAAVAADNLPPGVLDFDRLPIPARGGELVEVNITSFVLNMAARLVEKTEPQVAAFLQGLKSVRVNVVGLDEANKTAIEKKFQALRVTLAREGWEKVVGAQKKQQDVAVYLKTRDQQAVLGLVVTILDGGKQAVFINVAGDIQPQQLALLGERFQIEPLKKLNGAFPR